MASPLIQELHVLIMEEREIGPLFDGVPKDIREQYAAAEKALVEKFRSSPPDELEWVEAEVDALRGYWSDWAAVRWSKILSKAEIQVLNNKPVDLTGILPWERDQYQPIVDALALLRKAQGVKD